MQLRNKRRFTFLLSGALIASAAGAAIMSGCKNGGSSGSSSAGQQSFNPLDVVAGAIPGQNGQYAQAALEAGKKESAAVSLDEESEGELGKAVATQATSTYGFEQNEAMTDYVTLVGWTVATATPRPDRNYVFGILATDEVGAFSGPDGYVMITRGALKRMQDESELAGVLAHEIAHVVHQDGLNSVKQSGQLDAFTGLAASLTSQNGPEVLDQDTREKLYGTVAGGLTDVIFKKGYSRQQEDQADQSAVQYVAAAGYDPNGYAHFMQRMAQASGGNQSDLFSTHPGLADRAVRVATLAAQIGKGGATLADRFRKNVPQ